MGVEKQKGNFNIHCKTTSKAQTLKARCPRRRASNKTKNLRSRQYLVFDLSPLSRHRVAQTSQGISARTDETTSHSTKRIKVTRKSLVMFEVSPHLRDRVPQPPDWSSNAGNPEGMAGWGRLLLVTFLGETRKVTGCRATPDNR